MCSQASSTLPTASISEIAGILERAIVDYGFDGERPIAFGDRFSKLGFWGVGLNPLSPTQADKRLEWATRPRADVISRVYLMPVSPYWVTGWDGG